MDEDMKNGFFLLLMVLSFFVFTVSLVMMPIMYSNNKDAIASDKADWICKQRGYDTYDTFNRVSFTDKPLGIKCNHIENKREIITDSDVIAVVGG